MLIDLQLVMVLDDVLLIIAANAAAAAAYITIVAQRRRRGAAVRLNTVAGARCEYGSFPSCTTDMKS